MLHLMFVKTTARKYNNGPSPFHRIFLKNAVHLITSTMHIINMFVLPAHIWGIT